MRLAATKELSPQVPEGLVAATLAGIAVFPIHPGPSKSSNDPASQPEEPQQDPIEAGSKIVVRKRCEEFIVSEYLTRLTSWANSTTLYAAGKIRPDLGEPSQAFAPDSAPVRSLKPEERETETSSVDIAPILNKTALKESPQALGPSSEEKRHDKRQLFGFKSLVDVERSLLEHPSKWIRKWQGAHHPKKPGSKTKQDDLGLDVDLADAFETLGSDGELLSQEKTDLTKESNSSSENSTLFLGVYSKERLVDSLKSHGILESLAKRGYNRPFLVIDISDPYQHRLSVVDESLFDPTSSPSVQQANTPLPQPFDSDEMSQNLAPHERVLIDWYLRKRTAWGLDSILSFQLMGRLARFGGWNGLKDATGEVRAPYLDIPAAKLLSNFFSTSVSKHTKTAKAKQKSGSTWEMVEVAWVLMQDPYKPPGERMLLPSQRFSGLGMGRKIGKLGEELARSSKTLDGLFNLPLGWHNAFMYSSQGYQFFNPIFQAYFDWTKKQLGPHLKQHGFVFLAWAWANGHIRRIIEESNSFEGESRIKRIRERWSPEEQIIPISDSLKDYLNSSEYRNIYQSFSEMYELDGAASMAGDPLTEKGWQRTVKLDIDIEAGPEIWKFSLDPKWSTRAPCASSTTEV